jgi:hypothetical protein
MSDRDRPSQAGGERELALKRLDGALAEESRLRDQRKAGNTPRDLNADAALQAASDQVGARERWLESVDDHNY